MFYNAVNGTVPIDDTFMEYVAFGKGSKVLIMIPGLGEGLQTVGGTAIPFALLYRKLAKEFRVYMFSRRMVMPEDFTTRDMAEDIYRAMVHLHISSANIIGVSLGGMIVQHLAIDHPEAVEKLILCVTLPYQNDTLVSCLTSWTEMARRRDIGSIMADTLMKSNAKPSKLMAAAYRVFGGLLPKKHLDRFQIMAKAGIDHNAKDCLHRITCPTLIIGGKLDQIVTGEASQQLHGLIPHSKLYMYEGYGHGLYEEAPDFWDRVADFFR
ncbi:MAG: alpha/beta hydrolase [Oscillospiraceae bacterium]|nr:alpha/beta hydrolase [Oscillospiraceae bacterium]